MQIKSLAQKLYPLIGPVIFCVALWSISMELRGYTSGDIWRGIGRIDGLELLLSLLFTFWSYLALSCYDLISFQYIRFQLSVIKIVLAGFIVHTISPMVGFPVLTGGALRYRLYAAWGVPPIQIAQVILFSNWTLWVGCFSVAGLVVLISPSPLPADVDFPIHSLQPLGAICTVLGGIYLWLCARIKAPIRWRSRYLRLPSLQIAVAQIVTFAVDWGLAAAALYSLLGLSSQFDFLDFFGAYVIAMVAGLISTVPGGLGVFETVLIFFLKPFMSNPEILGTILAFRLIYYILPLLIALFALGRFELRQRRRAGEISTGGSSDGA